MANLTITVDDEILRQARIRAIVAHARAHQSTSGGRRVRREELYEERVQWPR